MNTYGPLFDKPSYERELEEYRTGRLAGEPAFDKPTSQFPNVNDTTTGQQLKEKGIAQVSEHNENWMYFCIRVVETYFLNVVAYPDFTGEDIRKACEFYAELSPKHPNAWGALINTLIKRKIIVPTGEHRKMKDSRSHARSTPVYKAK